MEMTEALLQMKNSLAKYAKSRMLHIAEAAESLKITEEHLAELIKQGKIRAFKMGEHWFMEEDWIHDFRALVKKSLLHEIESRKSAASHQHGWTRHVAPRRKIRPAALAKSFFSWLAKTALFVAKAVVRLIIFPFAMLRRLLSAVLIGGRHIWRLFRYFMALADRVLWTAIKGAAAAMALLIIAGIVGIMCLPLAQAGLNRDAIAADFLSGTYKAYNLPLAYVNDLAVKYPIDDERLTQALYRLIGSNAPGQVAGAFEAKNIIIK